MSYRTRYDDLAQMMTDVCASSAFADLLPYPVESIAVVDQGQAGYTIEILLGDCAVVVGDVNGVWGWMLVTTLPENASSPFVADTMLSDDRDVRIVASDESNLAGDAETAFVAGYVLDALRRAF